jgi:hypothetical protein
VCGTIIALQRSRLPCEAFHFAGWVTRLMRSVVAAALDSPEAPSSHFGTAVTDEIKPTERTIMTTLTSPSDSATNRRNGQTSWPKRDRKSPNRREIHGSAASKRTVTVNAAFLREIKEDHEELRSLLADLHCRFQRQIEIDECRAMIDRLYPLLDALAMHFSLEEAYGYFDDPLEVAPQFSEKASRLRNEHRDLYVALLELVEWSERLFYDTRHQRHALWLLQEELGPRFLNFERRLRRHEIEETALVCQAYATDIGVGD